MNRKLENLTYILFKKVRPIIHDDGLPKHVALFCLDFASPIFGALVVVAGGSGTITIQRHGQRLPLVKHHGESTLIILPGTKCNAGVANMASGLVQRRWASNGGGAKFRCLSS